MNAAKVNSLENCSSRKGQGEYSSLAFKGHATKQVAMKVKRVLFYTTIEK